MDAVNTIDVCFDNCMDGLETDASSKDIYCQIIRRFVAIIDRQFIRLSGASPFTESLPKDCAEILRADVMDDNACDSAGS